MVCAGNLYNLGVRGVVHGSVHDLIGSIYVLDKPFIIIIINFFSHASTQIGTQVGYLLMY